MTPYAVNAVQSVKNVNSFCFQNVWLLGTTIHRFYSWSHTQAQMGNGVQLGFSIDITL